MSNAPAVPHRFTMRTADASAPVRQLLLRWYRQRMCRMCCGILSLGILGLQTLDRAGAHERIWHSAVLHNRVHLFMQPCFLFPLSSLCFRCATGSGHLTNYFTLLLLILLLVLLLLLLLSLLQRLLLPLLLHSIPPPPMPPPPPVVVGLISSSIACLNAFTSDQLAKP